MHLADLFGCAPVFFRMQHDAARRAVPGLRGSYRERRGVLPAWDDVSMGRPASEVDITSSWVRSLLQTQHPDLAGETLRPVASGWDNAVFRLGEQFAVRLPRRSAAGRLIVNEQRWLPLLSDRLPLSVPAAARIGKPGDGYPWHWSVVPWLAGTTADISAVGSEQGERLAAFLDALHVPAPVDARA